MATSGSYGGFTYAVNELIEEAALRAGIISQLLTADLLTRGLRALNLMFAAMPNLRIYTWTQQQIIIPIYEGAARVETPDGTFNLLDRVMRTPTRLEGTLTSSASGTTSYADDDDFSTVFTQNAALGNLQIEFDTDTQVAEVGILWGSAGAKSFVIEMSEDDGVSWLQVGPTYSVVSVDRTWTWVQPDGTYAVTLWRIRMTSGTLVAREVYFGSQLYQDITLAKLTRNQYMTMPNKSTPGAPLQAWLDRQTDKPYLVLWSPPQRTYRYNHILAIQQRKIADVLTLNETLDVPSNWYEYVTAQLALRMCQTFPEAKMDRLPLVQAQVDQAFLPAQSEDRDGSDITIFPQIGGYT